MHSDLHCQAVEIYSTLYGKVYQCNKSNKFLIDFGGSRSAFSAHHFINFIKLVKDINLSEMAESSSRHTDLAILMPYYTERCFVLSLREVLQLRELLEGAKVMLHLNSLINECLQQYAC